MEKIERKKGKKERRKRERRERGKKQIKNANSTVENIRGRVRDTKFFTYNLSQVILPEAARQESITEQAGHYVAIGAF